jgi:glucokinase
MDDHIVIGVDIGGSHITSAAVDIRTLSILPGSSVSVKVDNKASKQDILQNWASAINQTIENSFPGKKVRLGFAMPGPFHYKTGLAMFERNDKYESLYNVSIPENLAPYIKAPEPDFRFLNDATAFGVGAASLGKARNFKKVIAITLGTGFGSAFIEDGIPLVKGKNLPKGGCLWDKPYREGIADDYFSTRWCIQRYQALVGTKVSGVREIALANDNFSQQVFSEFGTNMAEFILPFLKDYRPDMIILGGNVSHASKFFLPVLREHIRDVGVQIAFEISDLMEEAAIMGSAKLYDPIFWDRIKDELPNL